jgi:hypothetical protein
MKVIRVLKEVVDSKNNLTIKAGATGTVEDGKVTFRPDDVTGLNGPPVFTLNIVDVIGEDNYRTEDVNSAGLKKFDVGDEDWREYNFVDPDSGKRVTYKIIEPKEVYFYNGSSTHRVVDNNGVVHCVPSVGRMGCVLTWKPKSGKPAVAW